MKIADEKATLDVIKREIKNSKTATLAVAFWGAGAVEALGIEKRKKPLTVICNLTMGGTNPAEIRKLRKLKNVEVLQNNKLHAKVYHFDQLTIVGSSNASTNGLAAQGADELKGWRELNVILTEPDAIVAVQEKLKTSLKGVEISNGDLDEAERQWRERRKLVGPKKTRGSLLDALKTDPDAVAAQNIYIAAYRELLNDDGEAREKTLKEAHGKNMGLFEGWPEMPREVPILCFYIDEDDKPWPDGVWRVLPQDTDEDDYQTAVKRPDAGGFAVNKTEARAIWNLVSQKLEADKGWKRRGYCCLPTQELIP